MLKITLFVGVLYIGFCLALPVKRDAAAVTEKTPEPLTEADLVGMKEELKKEMSETDAERAIQILRKLNSKDTNLDDALDGLFDLLVLALPANLKTDDESLKKLRDLAGSSSSSSEETAATTITEKKPDSTESTDLTEADIEEMRIELSKVMDKKDADNIADFFKKFTKDATSNETAEGVIQLLMLALASDDKAGKEELLKLFTDSKEVDKVKDNKV